METFKQLYFQYPGLVSVATTVIIISLFVLIYFIGYKLSQFIYNKYKISPAQVFYFFNDYLDCNFTINNN